MKFQSVRGMNDIFPPEMNRWHCIEDAIRQCSAAFGYSEIRTPVVEGTELFKRGVGEGTDIVEKEMYTFQDRNGDSLTLRPEGTAGVVRAVAEHGLLNENPTLKLYYTGPMFRHERPQKGRYRQFYQFGVEYMGTTHPLADVEVMALMYQILKQLKLEKLIELRVSSVGCQECRPAYRQKLLQALQPLLQQIPKELKVRLTKNPQRVFDHKDEKIQAMAVGLPVMLDHLCTACAKHHSEVEAGLKQIEVPFIRDPKIVRGLDYYTQTAFEFVTTHLGAQAAVCGGGRYNKLVAELGGPDAPAVGFGVGLERVALLLEQTQQLKESGVEIFFVAPDEAGLETTWKLCAQGRAQGLKCDLDLKGRSVKSQFKRADRLKAQYAVIIGGSEVEKGVAVVKDMSAHQQSEVPMTKLFEFLIPKLRRS